MEWKKRVVDELVLRVFDESYPRIFQCLDTLDTSQIWDSPNEHIPSVGNLILHLCGNVRQWVVSGVCGEEDVRQREREFVPGQNISKHELRERLEALQVLVRDALEKLPAERLEVTLTIQGFEVSGFSAMIHVIEHFSYHTGQITTLTKLHVNRDLGYYADRDLG